MDKRVSLKQLIIVKFKIVLNLILPNLSVKETEVDYKINKNSCQQLHIISFFKKILVL